MTGPGRPADSLPQAGTSSEFPLPAAEATPRRHRWWRGAVIAVVALAAVVLLWNLGGRLVDADGGFASYLLIGVMIFGDAVCPVLPGETTLNAGSVLASTGQLHLGLVILAGAVGAVAGDSVVYWIARRAKGRVRRWLDRSADSTASEKAVAMLDRRGPVLLVFGRYIPGVRFALNLALGGVVHMSYSRFLAWSALSGTLWSIVTCLGAYTVGTAFGGYPVVSLIVTCLASTLLISVIIWIQSRWTHWRHPGIAVEETGRHATTPESGGSAS